MSLIINLLWCKEVCRCAHCIHTHSMYMCYAVQSSSGPWWLGSDSTMISQRQLCKESDKFRLWRFSFFDLTFFIYQFSKDSDIPFWMNNLVFIITFYLAIYMVLQMLCQITYITLYITRIYVFWMSCKPCLIVASMFIMCSAVTQIRKLTHCS